MSQLKGLNGDTAIKKTKQKKNPNIWIDRIFFFFFLHYLQINDEIKPVPEDLALTDNIRL